MAQRTKKKYIINILKFNTSNLVIQVEDEE